jgi:hypothetical protein
MAAAKYDLILIDRSSPGERGYSPVKRLIGRARDFL